MRKVPVLVAALLLTGLSLIACERPPVAPPPPVVEEGREQVNLEAFLQDRPAIGGKWYDYSVDGHVLEPKSEAWVLKTATTTFGFRISSVYDDDTGETGLFTLETVKREGAAWSTSTVFTAPANVKDGPPVCVDLSTSSGVDCGAAGWHLRFTLQSRLSVSAGFAVAEPAVFLADDVVVARVDGLGSLGDLPDPASLQALDDAAVFDTTEWDFSRYAKDLPVPGRVIGSIGRASAGEWGFVDGRFALVRFSVGALDANTLRFAYQRQPIEREDFTVPTNLGDVVSVDVDVSTLPVFVSFASADLLTAAEDMVGVSWPLQPPFAKRYDLVVVASDGDDDGLQLLLSPAAAALHIDP
ncbi:MAG: hypothetical protein Q8O67_25085 [Deltaproteobacteria bacterium]|nr:hypothetical protein [Deltaproteobacteria bacterium]